LVFRDGADFCGDDDSFAFGNCWKIACYKTLIVSFLINQPL